MSSRKNPKIKFFREIHKNLQWGVWLLSLVFLIVRSFSGAPGRDEIMIVFLLAFELSLFVWFLHYTARYFLHESKARRHWVIPSLVLFVFLTSPFAFSIARAALTSNLE